MRLRRSSGGADAATPLERVAIGLASLALSIGLIAVLSGFFASHDPAGVTAATTGPGQRFPDQGHAHLAPGELRPVYDSDPPTSGPHIPVVPTANGVALSNDQLLEALELGDVVLTYETPSPPPALIALAKSVAPFTPALAAAGQAVILAPRPRSAGVYGLAWTRMIHTQSPTDPALRDFAEFWLGKGASRTG
ncbi:MAG: DUF3105 domain-containing protein [Solirubrobacteraceae bacterium]